MLTRVYTKIDGKLAQWNIETANEQLAINMVRKELPKSHSKAIMAVIMKPTQMELF